jgi:hypothetical protein
MVWDFVTLHLFLQKRHSDHYVKVNLSYLFCKKRQKPEDPSGTPHHTLLEPPLIEGVWKAKLSLPNDSGGNRLGYRGGLKREVFLTIPFLGMIP